MKLTFKALAVVLVGAGLLLSGVPAFAADAAFCPMGGTLVKIEVSKDKALEWAKDRRKVRVAGEDGDSWSVLTVSRVSDDVALLVNAGGIFFGVSGSAGRSVDARSAEKAFGRDFRTLKDVVKKEMGDIWKANVAKMGGDDVQKLSDAVGLGTLEKGRSGWELKTEKCEGQELDASGL
jgi:hypothetical protein